MKNYCYSCMEEITQGDFCTNCMKANEADRFVHHLKPGTLLNNKYLVGNCLGEGGFGITYIGRDLTLDIKVAIKEYYPNGYVNRNNEATQLVTATTESQSEFFSKGKERFLQEARNIAKFIGEPGIVGVREYFECNNTAYIIMDYLDGENLSSYIKKNGKMAPESIFSLILPIVRSLQDIHDAGIIHRDISPDNIMYLKNGSLKLMDFGSARFFTNEEKEMSVMLKQGYAPEEQYRKNGNQGQWTDVYGLCATLYKCITGTTPEDALDRLRTDELKRPSDIGVEISKPLEIVLMYGLAVFKENRCQNMRELEDLIKKALSKQDVSVQSGRSAREDIYRTQAADDYYKTQVADEIGEKAVENSGDFLFDRSKPVVDNDSHDKGREKDLSVKTVIIIVVISAVIIMGVIGIMIFALLGNNDKKQDDNEKVTTTEVHSEELDNNSNDTGDVFQTVTMPLCVNKKLSTAKSELESLGLVTELEYAFDENVTKDYIVSQSISQGMEVDVGETIILTVSKGSSACPYDYSQKLVVTASSGSTSGVATLYEWGNGEWEEQTEYKCTLGKNGIGPGKEGSSNTPQGLHKLGVVLTSTSINTNMQTYYVTQNTCVIDDSNSPYYNTIMEKGQVPSGTSYDTIGKGLCNGTTYATIYIEHNGNGFSSSGVVAGGGSAIGVRGQYGSLGATYGDVDISSSDMQDLLKRLDAYENPMIEIKVD